MLAFLPMMANAEDKKKEPTDPKYLEGAITFSSDNRVMFNTEIKVPSMSKEKIYNLMLEWASNRFVPEGKLSSRVVYSDETESKIAASAEEYLVFSNSALSLDRTRIYYNLLISAEEGSCSLTMTRIHYWYDENRNGGEKYTAEEWITDDMALNKSKTKLSPITGKFRKKTIDLKDDIFNSAAVTLGQQMLAEEGKSVQVQVVQVVNQPAPQPTEQTVEQPVETPATATPEEPVAPIAVVAPPTVTLNESSELKEVSSSELPSNLGEISAEGRITLTASNGESIDLKSDNWGGFAKFFNKDVAYIIIDKSRIAASALMEESDTYTVSFYTAGSSSPSVVIDCKKSMSQQMSAEDLSSIIPNADSSKEYTMYMGEVIKASMR